MRRNQRFEGWLESLAPGLKFPGIKFLRLVFPIEMQRSDSDDLAILYIHTGDIGVVAEGA